MRLSRGLIAGLLLVLGGGAVVGCSSSSSLGPIQTPALPAGPSPTPLPTAPPAPTPPPIPTSAPATAQSLVTLSTPAPAAPQQIPVPVAGVAGYGGTIALPVPSSLPAGTAIAETASNSAIVDSNNVPALQSALRAAQALRAAAASQIAVLYYLKFSSTTTVTFPNAPAITLTVPSTSIIPNTSYYLAEYDVLRSSLGWQKAFEGPATVSGTTLTFAAPSPAVPLTFTAQVPLYFGLYAVSTSVPTPTPAPSATAAATPTPIPAFTLTSTTLSLLASGAVGSVTVVDPTGYTGAYAAASSASSVATVAVSANTVVVTAVGAGTATITVGDAQGRTATLTVHVTTTTLPLQ